MPLPFQTRNLHPRHPTDEQAVQQQSKQVHDRSGEQRRNDRADVGAEELANPKEAEEIEGAVHADHHQIALAEVDDAHDAEDDAEADAHQSVETTKKQSRRQRLQEVLERE